MNKLLMIISALLIVSSVSQAQDIPEILPPDVGNPEQLGQQDEKPNPVRMKNDGFFNPDAIAVKAGQVIDGSNWDDQNIADEYSKFTGNRVLLSSATQGMEIRFYQRGPLTNRQAADLLVKVLDMEGIVFVPSGPNEVKLLPKQGSGGSNGAGELEDIIDNERDIPLGDDYITFFMRLNYIKPDEAIRTFTQSLNGLDPGGKLAPVANASAILITGKAAFVRKLINQKEYIDVPTGNVNTSWVELKYADAEEVATTLNEIVNATQQSKTTAGVTNNAVRNNAPPIPGNNAAAAATTTGGGGSSAGETIPVQIVANARLNKIFIMGRPVDILFVEKLAREFDAPPTKKSYMKFELNFMIASDFLDVAAKALEALDATSSSQSVGSNSTGSAQNRSSQQSNNSGGNSGGSASGGGVSEFNVSDKPEALVIGKTLIVADNLANSILVQGPPESIRVISELISKLDGRPQQVMISTVFGKISLVDGMETGLDFGYFKDNLTGGVNSNSNLLNIADLTTLGSGLNIYGAYRDFTGALQLLETNSNFKTLSKPTVFTSNNRVAVIESGERIAVPTNTLTNTTSDTVTSNIEYRDVLLKFEVVPLINSNEEVTLQISLVNESAQETQQVSGIEVPTIATESITTTVTVPNNATIVLGGLVTETSRDERSGIPVLSRIPGVGRLFGSNGESVDRSELLLFIKPTIIDGTPSLLDSNAELEQGYGVSSSSRAYMNGVLPQKPLTVKEVSSSNSKTKPSLPQRSNYLEPSKVEPTEKKRVQNFGRGSQFRSSLRR